MIGKSCGGCAQHTGNGIGDDGAKAVGEVLKRNRTLKALFVEGLWFLWNHMALNTNDK